MAEYDAKVTPKQNWGEDGLAEVVIEGAINISTVLPLRNRGTENVTNIITRLEYPKGLIRINRDHLPSGESTQLKVNLSTEESITHQDWPHGGIMFV